MNKDEQFDRSLYENNKLKGVRGVKDKEFIEQLYLKSMDLRGERQLKYHKAVQMCSLRPEIVQKIFRGNQSAGSLD